jgi:hypothetical protein
LHILFGEAYFFGGTRGQCRYRENSLRRVDKRSASTNPRPVDALRLSILQYIPLNLTVLGGFNGPEMTKPAVSFFSFVHWGNPKEM